MGYSFETDDRTFDLTPENSVVNLFRYYPYYDYITYQSPEGKNTALLSGRLTRWLGGIALTPETRRELREIENDLGVFGELYGAYPRVIIDDHPTEGEYRMVVEDDLAKLERLANGE